MYLFVILDKRMVCIEIWNNQSCHPTGELLNLSLYVLHIYSDTCLNIQPFCNVSQAFFMNQILFSYHHHIRKHDRFLSTIHLLISHVLLQIIHLTLFHIFQLHVI